MGFLSDVWEYRVEDLLRSPPGGYTKIQQIIKKYQRCYDKLDTSTGIALIRNLPLDDIENLESFIVAAFKLV